jgi:signal recognition particle GTPase
MPQGNGSQTYKGIDRTLLRIASLERAMSEESKQGQGQRLRNREVDLPDLRLELMTINQLRSVRKRCTSLPGDKADWTDLAGPGEQRLRVQRTVVSR